MNKITQQNLKGLKSSAAKPLRTEVQKMDDHIKKMVHDLFARAEREVPEYGDFKVVFEEFKNPDKSLCATDFMLKIVKPSKNIKDHEKIRNLELVAYKLPTPFMAERVIASGTKYDILKQLQDDKIFEKIKDGIKSLSYNLQDI